MYEVNNRIKEVRKILNLSQTEFGKHLHVSRSVINNLERSANATEPNSLFLDNVSVTFDVNRVWLETGEGEMFIQKTRDNKIAAFVGEALADNDDDFKRDVLELLADLDAEDWQALKTIAKKINAINKKESREE